MSKRYFNEDSLHYDLIQQIWEWSLAQSAEARRNGNRERSNNILDGTAYLTLLLHQDTPMQRIPQPHEEWLDEKISSIYGMVHDIKIDSNKEINADINAALLNNILLIKKYSDRNFNHLNRLTVDTLGNPSMEITIPEENWRPKRQIG